MEYADLVMDNGELVRIEYKTEHQDELLDSIEHAMKRRDWWPTGRFEGCKAEYMGMHLDRVCMARVVGML